MNRKLIIFILLQMVSYQSILGQEIDTTLLETIEDHFSMDKTVNLEIKFGFFSCFGTSRTDIKNNLILNTVLAYLQNNRLVKINLISHSDCRGSEIYNKELTKRKAENLKKWFISNGVSSKRIKAMGMGEKRPIIKCVDCNCKDEEYEINNRVEISRINTNNFDNR